MTYVAIDVDGTLTRRNLSFAFGLFMYRHGLLSLWKACGAVIVYLGHKIGVVSIEKLHQLLFALIFQGQEHQRIEDAANSFFRDCLPPLLRDDVRREVLEWQERGSTLALLSSSPDFLVAGVAKALGILEWYATEYRCQSGNFSTLGVVMTGAVKASIVRAVREKTHEQIVAMSDSIHDIAFLNEADCGIAVYPGFFLHRYAMKRGWRVIS